MRTVLILMGRYLPGHKDGGPLRTIINVTEALGDEYDFKIVTLDRDHGDTVPYDAIRREQWNAVGKAKVWYVSPGEFTFKALCRFAKEADMIYCCGFYDDYGYKTLILNRLGRLFGKPVVVAGGIVTKIFEEKSVYFFLQAGRPVPEHSLVRHICDGGRRT